MALGKSSLYASCMEPLGIPLQSLRGPRSSPGVQAGNSGFLSCAGMEVVVPLESPQGSQASSRVETFKSAFLSSCKCSVRLPVVLT